MQTEARTQGPLLPRGLLGPLQVFTNPSVSETYLKWRRLTIKPHESFHVFAHIHSSTRWPFEFCDRQQNSKMSDTPREENLHITVVRQKKKKHVMEL